MAALKNGAVPKRDEDRLRRNKTGEDGLVTERYNMDDEVVIPTAFFFNSYINDLWLALKQSVNVKFFEPTDWAYCKLVLKIMDDQLGNSDKVKMPSGQMLMVFDGMMSKMLLTEADRRRMKIEAERGANKTEDGKVINAADQFRERFEQQREA